MALMRKTILVAAMLGTGLASSTGAALAHDKDHHHRGDHQSGVANVDDTQTVVPTDVCGNDVPVNVLGLQIPVQDVAGNIPVLSGSDDDGGNTAGVQKSCGSDVDTTS